MNSQWPEPRGAVKARERKRAPGEAGLALTASRLRLLSLSDYEYDAFGYAAFAMRVPRAPSLGQRPTRSPQTVPRTLWSCALPGSSARPRSICSCAFSKSRMWP